MDIVKFEDGYEQELAAFSDSITETEVIINNNPSYKANRALLTKAVSYRTGIDKNRKGARVVTKKQIKDLEGYINTLELYAKKSDKTLKIYYTGMARGIKEAMKKLKG